MTKEELIKQNSKQQTEIESYKYQDELRRQEFAKSLGWYKERDNLPSYWSSPKEPKTPSWEEIFTEIGKLLQIKSVKDQRDKIDELYKKNEKLWHELGNLASKLDNEK